MQAYPQVQPIQTCVSPITYLNLPQTNYYALSILVGRQQLDHAIEQGLDLLNQELDMEIEGYELRTIGKRVVLDWLAKQVEQFVLSFPDFMSSGTGCDTDFRYEVADQVDVAVSKSREFSW